MAALATVPRCESGNFNPTTGRCTCPIGRGGSRCELHVLQACRNRAYSTTVSCVVPRPQHCKCVEQCLAHDAFAMHMYPFCFTRSDGLELSELRRNVSFFEWEPAR